MAYELYNPNPMKRNVGDCSVRAVSKALGIDWESAYMATMQNGMNSEVDALYNRLKNCPVPTMPVYGNTPIFTCGQNTGCGCGSF